LGSLSGHGPLPDKDEIGRAPDHLLDGIFRITRIGAGGDILQSQQAEGVIDHGTRPRNDQGFRLNDKNRFSPAVL
jgi:hypothetical protein